MYTAMTKKEEQTKIKYLNEKIFNRKNSFILKAPTGSGKTTALLKYLHKYNKQVIIVSPLNSLSKQICEKSNGLLEEINCTTVKGKVIDKLLNTLSKNKSVIISLKTFNDYRNLFYNIPIYIDEAHLIIEHSELNNPTELIEDINNNKFKKIVLMTATPLGLDIIFDKVDICKPNIEPKYIREIDLFTITKSNLKYRLKCLLDLYKEKGKLVVLLNDKTAINELANELKERNLNVKIFTSEVKEIEVNEERFTQDFDIILCTSSLTTGVSITDNFYSVYFMSHHDTLNTLPQFFARNRNKISYGCIVKNKYIDSNFISDKIEINPFANKTGANKTTAQILLDELMKKKYFINETTLTKFLGDEYIVRNTDRVFDKEEELLKENRFEQMIDDQKAYFIRNSYPKFNKSKYPYLYKLYTLYDIYTGNLVSDDEVLNEMLKGYELDFLSDIFTREEFFDKFYVMIENYKQLKSINIASKSNEDTIDIERFEEYFLNKKFIKKEFKEICIREFAVRNEVFKNQASINIFLDNIGYELKRSDSGKVLRNK